jgi:hypothetical protein
MHPVLSRPLDELSALRGRVDALARDLDDVRARLDRIDAAWQDDGRPPSPSSPAAELLPPAQRGGSGEALALIGRAFLVLGGGLLVRAFTETGALSSRVGVACGFVYAMALVAWAGQGARHGRPRQGLADGIAAALIVFPLLWEGVGRFAVLTGAGAAVALAVAAHALLAAAAASALPALAWVAAMGAVATALVLLPATHALVPLTMAVLVLAFTTRALARARAWAGLGWPALSGAALLVGAGVFVTTGAEAIPATFASLRPAQVIALALGLPVAVLLASAVPRRDRLEMPVSGVVQVAASVAVGYASALRVAAGGFVERPLALFGVAGAAAALGWGETRRRRQPVHADASALVALAVAVYASVHLLGPAGRVASWLAVGVGLCVTRRSSLLGWTGGVLLALAAVQAGVMTGVLRGLGGAVPAGRAALILAAAVLAAVLASRRALAGAGEAVARLRDALALLALAPLALLALAAALAPVAADPARRATATTAVLAGTAVVLAARVRTARPFGPRWLPYAALAAAGAKLVLFDLRQGRPATLFVAFVIYGVALMFASRALRGEPARRP